MVNLVSHRVRIGRAGRLWLREQGIRVRPFKASLAAFLRMENRVQLRVRHRWVEDLGGRFNDGSAEQFHCGLPVVLDFRLFPSLMPLGVMQERAPAV